MSNFPDGMTSSDWDHVEGVGMFEGETMVLRAVVYLTYEPHGAQAEDEMIDEVQDAGDAENDIARLLKTRLEHSPDKIEVVDAEYMSQEESEDYPFKQCKAFETPGGVPGTCGARIQPRASTCERGHPA
jgi:hypothetical protein